MLKGFTFERYVISIDSVVHHKFFDLTKESQCLQSKTKITTSVIPACSKRESMLRFPIKAFGNDNGLLSTKYSYVKKCWTHYASGVRYENDAAGLPISSGKSFSGVESALPLAQKSRRRLAPALDFCFLDFLRCFIFV